MYKLRDWIDISKVKPLSLPDKYECESDNPEDIHFLRKNQDCIDWYWISVNTEAIDLIEENINKINWNMISSNPAIFEYDYKNMTRPFTEELMQNRFHPNNLDRFEAFGI